MDERRVIVLLLLAVVASGCSHGSQGEGIAVRELSVQPSNIRAGQTVSVSLEAVNAGLLQGNVSVGEEDGRKVLTNYCPDYFTIQDFSASSSRTSDSQEEYRLGEDERIRMYWRLKQQPEDQVPLQGYDCPLKFELPFDYTVRAYKQLQVKQSREASGSPDLSTDISPGPLSIDMELIGTTAQQSNTILKQDDPSLYLTAYNTDSEESAYQGLIEINDIRIQGGGAIDVNDECGQRESVTLASGGQEIYRCDIQVDDFSSPSVRGEITVDIDYTFVKSLGERRLSVE
jgi:hypothetical protein